MLLRRCLRSSRQLFHKSSHYRNNPVIWPATCGAKIHTSNTIKVSESDKITTNIANIADKYGSKDLLIQQIKNSKNLASIMQLAESHHLVMNNNHLALVFNMIHHHNKKERLTKEITNSEKFQKLCNSSMKRIRFFSRNEIISMFKTIVHLNMPQDIAIYQAVVQMLRHFINDFTLQEITFLEMIFFRSDRYTNKQNSSPLIEAIKMALPIAFKSQLEYQLDENNLELVVSCMKFALRYNIKTKAAEKLPNIILRNSDNLTPNLALSLFIAILHTNYLEIKRHEELLGLLLQFLSNFILHFDWKQTHPVLAQLAVNPGPVTKNEKLLTMLSHKAVKENWELWKLNELLTTFIQMEFVSTEVLDLVARRIEENPGAVATDPAVSIVTLVEAFSEADYLPSASKALLDPIINCVDKIAALENKAPHMLVKFVANLAILGGVTEELLAKVLHTDFVDLAKRKTYKANKANLMQYYRVIETAARLEFNDYKGPFLDSTYLEHSISDRAVYISTKPIDEVLKKFLEIGLGGSQFMLSGLWTRFGHFIDHLIIMRKGDFPVALNLPSEDVQKQGSIQYVEDLNIPQDAKILAVMVARQEWFTTNPYRQRGWASFNTRTLAQLGYNPVTLGPPVITKGKSQDLIGHLINEDC